MSVKEVNLKITEDGVFLQQVNNDGTVLDKDCDKDQLLKLIEGALSKKKSVSYNSGLLHPDILEIANSHHLGKGETTTTYLFYVEGGEMPFNYYGKIYILNFPNLIFKVDILEGGVVRSSSRVYAVLEQRKSIEQDTMIYRYPFGNVDSRGWICFGGNQLPKIETSKDLFKIAELFLGTQTKDDYTSGNEKFKFNGTHGELIRELSNKKLAIEDILVPYCSYQELMNKNRG